METTENEGFDYPESYLDATPEERAAVVNQCGPNGWLNKFIPNSILGLDISRECDLHDWNYSNAKTSEDFKKADHEFLKNILEKIKKNNSNFILKFIRKGIAFIYFSAVRIYSNV